jgi:imidazole glycerol phosphate synthase glutamine amidotransferase subunit
MIGIIDYGAGNLSSVRKAFEYLGQSCKFIDTADNDSEIERLVLPGVGSFQTAIRNIKRQGLFDYVNDWLKQDKPFLGICLGMQVLFKTSDEAPEIHGFDMFDQQVKRFGAAKVPQIGWNQVMIARSSTLMSGIEDKTFFYFLHSYYVPYKDDSTTLGMTEYSTIYTSIINQGNVYAVQFHPEKSGRHGLKLLENWVLQC